MSLHAYFVFRNHITSGTWPRVLALDTTMAYAENHASFAWKKWPKQAHCQSKFTTCGRFLLPLSEKNMVLNLTHAWADRCNRGQSAQNIKKDSWDIGPEPNVDHHGGRNHALSTHCGSLGELKNPV